MGAGEQRAVQMGALPPEDLEPAHPGPLEVRVGEVGSLEVGAEQESTLQMRTHEVCTFQMRAAQVRFRQVAVRKHCSRKADVGQIEAPAGRRLVLPVTLVAAAQYGRDRLSISSESRIGAPEVVE